MSIHIYIYIYIDICIICMCIYFEYAYSLHMHIVCIYIWFAYECIYDIMQMPRRKVNTSGILHWLVESSAPNPTWVFFVSWDMVQMPQIEQIYVCWSDDLTCVLQISTGNAKIEIKQWAFTYMNMYGCVYVHCKP